MSLIKKIYKELSELNELIKLEKYKEDNYNFSYIKPELEKPEDVIQKILSEDKRLNNLKTEKGKSNAFFSLLVEYNITYQVFKELCVFFKYEYNLIDFIAFRSAIVFLFDLNKIPNEETSIFLKDKNNHRSYYDDIVFTRQYNEAALMLHQDFIDYLFSFFKNKNKKRTYNMTPFVKRDSTYDYLKKIIPEKKLKPSFEKLIKFYCDDIEKDPRRGLGKSREDFYKIEMSSFNGDNFESPKKTNADIFIRNLNAKIENSLFSLYKTRQNYNLKILFRSVSQKNEKYTYNHVLVIDNSKDIITSAETLVLDDDIKTFFMESIELTTTYNIKTISDSVTENINEIVVELEDKEHIKSLNKIIPLFKKDSSLMIDNLKFELSYSNEEVMVSFICDRWAGRDNRERYAKILSEEFDMLGQLKYINYESGSMPSYERYYFRLKINKQKIDKYLKHYNPVERLETGILYEVTKNSLGLKKGTTFYFERNRDAWRKVIVVKKGFILENDEIVEAINKEYILFNFFGSSFSAQTSTIPKCKIIQKNFVNDDFNIIRDRFSEVR